MQVCALDWDRVRARCRSQTQEEWFTLSRISKQRTHSRKRQAFNEYSNNRLRRTSKEVRWADGTTGLRLTGETVRCYRIYSSVAVVTYANAANQPTWVPYAESF